MEDLPTYYSNSNHFIIGILLDFFFKPSFFTENTRLIWYVLAYLPVALPAFEQAWGAIKQKDFFTSSH